MIFQPHVSCRPICLVVAILCVLISSSITAANDELQKRMAPFMGRWSGESKAFGGFEGTTDEGDLSWNIRFRWLPGKQAVEHTWKATYLSSQKNFSSGTEILFRDADSGELKVISFGVDGDDVAWSNHGTVKWVKRGTEVSLHEKTENGIASEYVVRRVKQGRNRMALSIPSRKVDGKELAPVKAFVLQRQPSSIARNRKMAEAFFADLLTNPEELKAILHPEFRFTYMGKIDNTIVPYGVPYDTDTFFSEWLPHIPKLAPQGIKLNTTQVIASDTGVAIVQKGDAQGKYGRYDNDYVWVFNFKDGKILSVEEYNSDYLVATRLYGQKLKTPEE